MLNIATATKTELETEICCNSELYGLVDEQKLLSEQYTLEELREIISAWIEAGDECSAA